MPDAGACRGDDIRRPRGASVVAVLALVLAFALPRPVTAVFVVESATTEVRDGVVMLDASIDFRFSDAAREAMESAVPLTVVVEVEVLREGTLWNRRVADIELRYRVETHPLSQRFVVTQLNSGDARTYRAYESMRSALGRIEQVPLIDAHLLRTGASHRLRVRAQLDVEALPSPLRPIVYVSGTWQLGSGWLERPLER